MNNQAVMGGPVGAQQMMNAGTPNNNPPPQQDLKRKLNTYIYDYFLKNEMYDLARILFEKGEIEQAEKPSPDRKGVNGAHDDDSKDDMPGKPADLPRANVPGDAGSSFLLDWWSQFWDCWAAARTKSSSSTKQYLVHMQGRMANERQRMNPQMQGNMNARNMMMQNGMTMGNMDMKKAMMMQQAGRAQNPAQMAQLQMQQRQMTAQGQMQREGSQMDMNGQPRPQTPGNGDNAPSPKRQRLDGAGFNGQMVPMGRGQNPAQQFNNMQMQAANAQKMAYANSMAQQMQSAMDSNGQKGMPGPNGLPQGSPGMDANGEAFSAANLRNLQQGGGLNNNSNGALQDYQMQLMLLEQQNKKRLLMARQEQETSNGPGGQMDPNNPQAMLANGIVGPSPGPEEQMKRGTPKMGPGGIPQAGMDGMPQGRASPVPGFDPNQMAPGMPPNFQGMKMGGPMMGPNGQMMQPNPHAFAQMNGQFNPQHMEMMRQQAANRQQNGPWGQGPPGVMHGGMPQQQPNMTPQQRNTAMPPPPAPATGEQSRTQPSSPQIGGPAPPTPSQTNKPNPKSKKESAKASNKKAPANKKGATTAATPASEAGEQPPTPTPAPTAAPQQFNKGASNATAQPAGPPQNAPNGPAPQPQADLTANSFGAGLDGADMDFGMNFAGLDGPDVLDNFDFDSFLNQGDNDAGFAFDSNMTFDANGGLEAGTDI